MPLKKFLPFVTQFSGELYWSTNYAFGQANPWTDIHFAGGNGDGTLFYPGTQLMTFL